MFKKLLALLITSILIIACNREASTISFKSSDDLARRNPILSGEAQLDFESLRKYILKPKCMSCHSGEEAKPKNDPIDFSTYESTVIERFIPLLVKGKPEKSRLYLSVKDGEMPEDGSLSITEIEYIKKWIEACAPKDSNSETDNCLIDGPGDDGPGDDGPGDDGPGDEEPGEEEPGDDEPQD